MRSSRTRSSLAWVRDGHLADFVEQEGAVLGQLEAAGAALDGAGEGAFLVAEELALDQRLGNGRAVDGDKGLAAAGAEVVQGAGDEFLAGAALAGDEHRNVAGGDTLDQREDLLHLRRRADQGAEDAGFAELAAGDFELDAR